MRASADLSKLNSSVQYRLDRLLRLYSKITQVPHEENAAIISYIAIELDNLNICVMRELAISTLRSARTISGARISVNCPVEREEEVTAYILSVLNSVRYLKLKQPRSISRADEYSFRDPKELEKIYIASGASNIGSLRNALSLNSSVFRDLKRIRHFYAHRCKDTSQKFQRAVVSSGTLNIYHPNDYLLHVRPGRPYSILEEWMIEAKLFYELAMH